MVSHKLLQSLYVINKHAKQYAEQATENYHAGNKTTARQNSIKKDALYTVKSLVLDTIKDDANNITLHKINSKTYYCFTFDEFSFHSPYRDHNISVDGDVTKLSNFSTSSDKQCNRSLKDSLQYISSHTGINANNHLKQEYVSYSHRSYFTGWSYL